MNLGFVYDQTIAKNLLLYGLSGYANSNFAIDPKDCKLVMGYYFFFNGVVVLWSSKRQPLVSILMTETEYIALGYGAREIVWMKKFVNKLELEVTEMIIIYGNNKMSIALLKNVKSQQYTKHIIVQYYYIRELIKK